MNDVVSYFFVGKVLLYEGLGVIFVLVIKGVIWVNLIGLVGGNYVK